VMLLAKPSNQKPLGWEGPPLKPTGSEPKIPQPPRARHTWLWILLGLIGLVMIVSQFDRDIDRMSSSSSSTVSSSVSTYRIDKIEAWVMAKEFVKDRLKAPRTAKWPWASTDQLVTYLGNREYLVDAYVDAQNSFGALIRTYFTCRLRDDGDRWTLLSLSFHE